MPNASRRRAVLAGLLSAAASLYATGAFAQSAPVAGTVHLDKPVRIIVAYGAGGASDSIARYVAEGLSRRLDKLAIVENKPGADGNLAAEAAVNAPADAHTLLVSGSSTHAANVTIYRKLPYDPEADFTPLATMAISPYVLLVNPKRVQAATFAEFLASAKASNEPLTYASAAVGSRITGELMKKRTGLRLINVPYKASGQAMTDLIGGQLDYYWCDMVTALPQIQAKVVRALAISSAERDPALPDVPTMIESGFENFDVSSWIAIWSANGSTPPATAKLLSRLIGEMLESPEGRKFLIGKGLTPTPVAPSHLLALQRRDTREWGEIIIDAGMRQP
ncbi:MAG: tripartite tricarboxylate transporter substrate binding protein [Burkholderiaceae bacterium]